MRNQDRKTTTAKRLEPQLRRRIALSLGLVSLLVGGLFGWGAMASIASAVIAPGLLVVDGSGKKVQHPTGGVIGAIFVKNGDRVEAGEVVVRLDATQTRAALGVVTSQQVQLRARKARLEAERDQAPAVKFDAGFAEESPNRRRSAIVSAAFTRPARRLKQDRSRS